jgi:hypothetical protein
MPGTDEHPYATAGNGSGCVFNEQVYCELIEKVDDLTQLVRNTLSIVKGNYAMLQRIQGYEERLRRLEVVALPREED